MASSSSGNRPFAPAAAGIVAAILVFLVLPNPLKVPQNNPTASAEYAPVPGRSDQNASGANFGETGLSNSAGVGTGGTGTGALPGFNDVPPPPQFVPRDKQCVYVGGFARQTEDPLSPPCVPFYQGDNGGATAQGVTGDSIKVIFYNDQDLDGDMNAPYKTSEDSSRAGRSVGAYEDVNFVRTIKSDLRYFQQRYQTYGRVVKLQAMKSAKGLGTPCGQRQSDADTAYGENDADHPFASVVFGEGTDCYINKMASAYNVSTFGMTADVPRASYEKYANKVWGFLPDQETQTQWSAAFICRKLYKQQSQSKDSDLKGTRKFGLIVPEGSWRSDAMEVMGKMLQTYVKDMCGMTFDAHASYDASNSNAPAGAKEAPGIISNFIQKGITTVVCYCTPVQTEDTVTTMQGAATTADYHPEWYWDDASYMDRAIWEQTYGSKEQQSFGTSYFWRANAFRTQYHYRAFKSVDPDGEPNARFNFNIYHLFLNLFEAIQAAGPNLTNDTIQQGMYTFNYTSPDNPYVPTGGYGLYDPKQKGVTPPGPYTFVDTAMQFWWDPTGTPPGSSQKNTGCIRVVDGGKRYYWNQWPKGDANIFDKSAPCSQEMQKLADPGSSSSTF